MFWSWSKNRGQVGVHNRGRAGEGLRGGEAAEWWRSDEERDKGRWG